MQGVNFPETRIGPIQIGEVTELLIALWSVPSQQRGLAARTMLSSERHRLSSKYQPSLESSRRATVRSVFEGKALGSDYPSLFGQQWEQLQKPLKVFRDWGSCEPYEPGRVTADTLAFYLPGQLTNDTPQPGYGVVFCASNFGRFVEEAALDAALTISTVAVHEWFHGFIEAALAPHNKVPRPGFNALEEAAANRVALDWLRFGKEAHPAAAEALERALFEASQSARVPGYGEYDKVDNRVASCVPELLESTAAAQPNPDGYFVEAAYRLWKSSRGYQDQILWNGFLVGLTEETIPCYIELGGYL